MTGWRQSSHAVGKSSSAAAVKGKVRGGWKRDQGGRLLDPSCELEVLKCIMLREGYLARVTRLIEDMTRRVKKNHSQHQALPPGMVDLLDLLRIATLDTIEAISLWRLSQVTPTPAPFEWNGYNYLTKMLQDCDFLDQVGALRSWLGFRMSGNPFFFLHQGNIGEGSDTGSNKAPSDAAKEEFEFDKTGVTDVGRQPWLGPLEIDIVQDDDEVLKTKDNRSKRRKLRKARHGNSLAPYAAAVVNDLTLLPTVKAPPLTQPGGPDSAGGTGGSRADVLGLPPKHFIVDIKGLVPNTVSREDAQRIGVAKRVLMEEERRVREATTAAEEVDGSRRSRQRSRASSILSDEGGRNRQTSAASSVISNATSNATRGDPPAHSSTISRLPSKRRISTFGQHFSSRKGSTAGKFGLDSRIASTPPETGGIRSIVLTTAGLQQQPPPKPYPGLGPVLLRSDRPGGDLHPSPFLHTVSDVHAANTDDLQLKLSIMTPNTSNQKSLDRCSTVPTVTSCMTNDSARRFDRRTTDRRPSANQPRVSTAPGNLLGTFAPRGTSVSDKGLPHSCISDQGVFLPRPGGATTQEESERPGSTYSTRGLGLSRKAGAELRALTAAGTTGRRQPPPRELRLRRLARDVARHSAELRRLVGEEDRLRKSLARCCCSDGRPSGLGSTNELNEREKGAEAVEDDTVALLVALRQDDRANRRNSFDSGDFTSSGSPDKIFRNKLEAKQREIELKTFDLGIKRDELRCLRIVQKQERERKLALEMERRRAHLDEGQRLPEDEIMAERLEDSSSLLVQKRFRGNVGRTYAAWYKGNIQQAATTIQRGVRFVWDRRATRRRLLLYASARPMQAAIRMFVKRQRYKRLLREKRELLAACKLQVVGRGMLGRRRAAARRSMKAAATKALDWVSLENLKPGHLKELARAIHGALVDPVRQFPPAGILGALRVALTILDDANDATNTKGVTASSSSGGSSPDMVTFQTALGRTVRSAVSAPDLTWEMAARVLGRPFRLLRRMRAFASGLGASSDSTPVRLLHLFPKTAKLLSAYRSDPSWSFESLSAMTEGATAAKAVVGWATELERVYREQPWVLKFLRDAQPAWLRKGRSFQRRRRALELHVESCRQGVTIAREHCQHLKTRGRAYGDPVLALDMLEKQLEEAEKAARELESRRNVFLVVQAKVEEAAGRALREDVEFAEREVSVAVREEEMAARLGQSGPEELEALADKVRDCEVVVRELLRRLRVWERRCREEKKPLLDEWVPPTEGQGSMSRALGEARAWKQVASVQKARLIKDAGGRRFLKGLTGKDIEIWRRVSEGLAACGADVESGEARIAEDVGRFELELSRANEEIAAEKVMSAPWDNATEETQVLERQEDADAARDERRTAMGATLPAGMLGNGSQSLKGRGKRSSGCSSYRPTLLLLGLDLPASVRDGIRAGLDRDAPELFGCHIVGADALPSLASVAQTAAGGRGFLEPCREAGVKNTSHTAKLGSEAGSTGSSMKNDAGMSGMWAPHAGGEGGRGGPTGRNGSVRERETATPKARANLVQAVLSKGKSVSLEVVPGPGLWARGRFLRDLEALLGGLDDCGCDGEDSTTNQNEREGPTVLLVDGHRSNRSGGGTDLSHGTKFVGKAMPQREYVNHCCSRPCVLRNQEQSLALPPASLNARRAKALLEEASQCLHDLSTTYGETPSPFKAIMAASRASQTSHMLREVHKQRGGSTRGSQSNLLELSRAGRIEFEQPNNSLAAEGSPGMKMLLAACHMLLHPNRQYDVGENDTGSDRAAQNVTKNRAIEKIDSVPSLASNVAGDHAATLEYTSGLADKCRQELAEKPSARGVAEILRGAAVCTLPLETAVALRRVVRHPEWPGASPRPDFTECPASEAFTAWVVAAVYGATDLALEGGGGEVGDGVGFSRDAMRTREEINGTSEGPGVFGRIAGAESAMNGGGSDTLPPLTDAQAELQLERNVLQGMEATLVDEKLTVLDDDSPWLLLPSKSTKEGGNVQDPRQCRSSEVLNSLMEIALRPFNVFEEADCLIPVANRAKPNEKVCSPTQRQGRYLDVPLAACDGETFNVSVSRAFGFIYARAVSLGKGRMRRGQATMARTRDEDLIPLLSPNWMEKHDLSALRELRTEPAVWRALVTNLVLRYSNEVVPAKGDIHTRPKLTKECTTLSSTTLTNQQHAKEAAPASRKPEDGDRKNGTLDGTGTDTGTGTGIVAAVLSFRHERRLTLTTSCVLMGSVVSVSVFEESRSDFWCEAEVPAALTSLGKVPCSVGMCVPKECIPLILNDNHPMRMQTILDASDLRHLSVLIADRLKLCRVGSARKGSCSYHHWLNGAIGGESKPRSANESGGVAAGFTNAEQRDEDQSEQEFKLSLRKRSVGQVVFSRLLSFWVPSLEKKDWDKVKGGATVALNNQDNIGRGRKCLCPSAGRVVQRLVTVKEFAHRAECGELRGEVHDPDSVGQAETFIPTPELTRTLLGDWRAGLKSNDQNRGQSARYWRESLTWRFRVVLEAPCVGDDINESKTNESRRLGHMQRTAPSPSSQNDWVPHLTVDHREPLFSIRRINASLGVPPTSTDTSSFYFDLLILPPRSEASNHPRTGTRKQQASIEFVATNRKTMAVFNFYVSAKAFVKEFDAFVATYLTAPTALATELELPASDTVLRNLARKWLQYSPGSSQNGHRTTLTFSFPRTKATVAEPYVGLSSCNQAIDRTRHFKSVRKGRDRRAKYFAATTEAGPKSFLEGHASPEGKREETGRNERKSIATLQLQTRNERMVFRRRLPVPRSGSLGEWQNDHAPALRLAAGLKQGGAGELASKVLAVSVYETFTAGSDGRIERHLRFCARNETVRPALETTTTIPWAGTCEGVEGGKLWRVVTNGLRLGCTHDGEGKCVGMYLDVSTDVEGERPVAPHHNTATGQPNSDPLSTTLLLKGGSNGHECSRKTTAEAREPDTHGDGQQGTAGFAGNDKGKAEGERPAHRRGQTAPGNVSYEAGDPIDSRQKQPDSETPHAVGLREAQAELITPTHAPDSLTPDLLEREGGRGEALQGAEPNVDETATLYSGWHRITGIRLHVQCFQEEHCTRKGLDRTLTAHDIDGLVDPSRRRLLGRGGAASLPCSASLRFLVCDPNTGYRTGVKVTVSDLCRNLSADGGIVEAGLLDAGRRPVLARAIAQNLRLVFEVGGGYSVVLPLPAKWNRSLQQAG